MNTWEIIKEHHVRILNARPGTMGQHLATNQAAELFMAIKNNGLLTDAALNESLKAFNDDKEVREGLLMRGALKELELIK